MGPSSPVTPSHALSFDNMSILLWFCTKTRQSKACHSSCTPHCHLALPSVSHPVPPWGWQLPWLLAPFCLLLTDERDRVQKKTFTKWVNKHLMKVRKHINDLYEDLRDGHNLISLLEVLSGVKLPREKGRMRFHRLQNVQIALDFLKQRQVKLVNIRNDDITDGNPKLTLGLIWTIILHFQISDIYISGESGDMSAKEKLLLWTQKVTAGYIGVKCTNFSSCWSDGKMFNALIHRYRPDLVDMERVQIQSNRENLEQAFEIAERLGVTRLLDAEDVDVPSPDEKSVITYVSSIYDAFPKVPEGGEGISAIEVDSRWLEYQTCVESLVSWIKQHTILMSDKSFPQNPVELKALYNQYIHFKETEIPAKEQEKGRIEELYKLLEVWIEFGRIKLPQGYHPNDVEEEWGKLIIEMLEREKLLRPAVERLELLLQIANKIQNGALSCEEKLTLAKNTLQADAAHLESGQPVQYEHDVVMYLQECEGLIRQLQVDVQILRDENYYQLEELVFRIMRLQDELVTLRLECTNLYRKGHFSTLELVPTSTLSTTHLKGESLTKGLHTSSASWFRKPMTRTELVAISSSEDEGSLRFVYELLAWVEEMQMRLERAEWGTDLPSVETQLETQRHIHTSVEDLGSSVKEARMYEGKMSQNFRASYTETLGKLETQYCKLMETSSFRLRHLQSLHGFVSRATAELIWLNEKEEEELAYDWSDSNTNIAAKKSYFSELMTELDEKQDIFRSLQDTAELLSLENHPAKQTVEAYSAAVQTQWQWIKQLCLCVEQHVKENAAYFQFFSDARELEAYLRNLQDSIKRKYSCDHNTSLTRLEDLLQDSMDEKEQLIQSKSSVASLVGRSKTIVQLRPRNPEHLVRSTIPIKAVCDYRQIEITICRNDECVLEDNSQRTKWKVISPTGNEAMVPSVCFLIPPPNKEAIEMASRIEQLYQKVMALWHQLHMNTKSLISWNYLRKDIALVQSFSMEKLRSLAQGECQQAVKSLQAHYEDFLQDSRDSELFSVSDRLRLEEEVESSKEHIRQLLESMENEDKDESVARTYLSELKNIRLHLEECEQRLVSRIQAPSSARADADTIQENTIRIAEQERMQEDLQRLQSDLRFVSERCYSFLNKAPAGSSAPHLRSELDLVVNKMDQMHGLSSTYLQKLKTVDVIIRNAQGAESLVKGYEVKLSQEEAVPADLAAIQSHRAALQQWLREVKDKGSVFSTLEEELAKAKVVGEQLYRLRQERSIDLERYQEKGTQLWDRWQRVCAQIETRHAELESIQEVLSDYRQCHSALIQWIEEITVQQELMKPGQAEDSRVLSEQLSQQTALAAEIENNQAKLDQCQKFSQQYSAAVKDYELQLMTYRAFVESQQKSPMKRRRMLSSSDAITQEFMDLRTRYTALVTLTTQHVKYISDALRRLEEEEKVVEEEKQEHVDKVKELLGWAVGLKQSVQGRMAAAGSRELGDIEKSILEQQALNEELAAKKEQVSEAIKTSQIFLAKHSHKEGKDMERVLEVEEGRGKEALGDESVDETSLPAPAEKEAEDTLEMLLTQLQRGGIVHEQTGRTLLLNEAVSCGVVPSHTAVKLMEKMKMFSGFFDPQTCESLTTEDVIEEGLMDERLLQKVLASDKAISGVLDPGNNFVYSVKDAAAVGLLDKETAMRILEGQVVTGGIVDLKRGKKVSVTLASNLGLIEPTSQKELVKLEKASKGKGTDEVTREKLISLQAETSGIVDPKTKQPLSVAQSVEKGLLKKEKALQLLTKQIAEGGIIHHVSGMRLSVNDAMKHGLIDQDLWEELGKAESVCLQDYVHPDTKEKLPLAQAVSLGLLSPDFQRKVQEIQAGSGSILDPASGHRLALCQAVQEGLVPQPVVEKALSSPEMREGMVDPETCMVVPYSEFIKKCKIDIESGQRYLQVHPFRAIRDEVTGQKLTCAAAVRLGKVDPVPALRLLQAQADGGGVVEGSVSKRLSLRAAVEQGLLDEGMAKLIAANQLRAGGIVDASSGKRLALKEAVEKELISQKLAASLQDAQVSEEKYGSEVCEVDKRQEKVSPKEEDAILATRAAKKPHGAEHKPEPEAMSYDVAGGATAATGRPPGTPTEGESKPQEASEDALMHRPQEMVQLTPEYPSGLGAETAKSSFQVRTAWGKECGREVVDPGTEKVQGFGLEKEQDMEVLHSVEEERRRRRGFVSAEGAAASEVDAVEASEQGGRAGSLDQVPAAAPRASVTVGQGKEEVSPAESGEPPEGSILAKPEGDELTSENAIEPTEGETPRVGAEGAVDQEKPSATELKPTQKQKRKKKKAKQISSVGDSAQAERSAEKQTLPSLISNEIPAKKEKDLVSSTAEPKHESSTRIISEEDKENLSRAQVFPVPPGQGGAPEIMFSKKMCLEHDEKLISYLSMLRDVEMRIKRVQPAEQSLAALHELLQQALGAELQELSFPVNQELDAVKQIVANPPEEVPEQLLKALEKDAKNLQKSLSSTSDVLESRLQNLRGAAETEKAKILAHHETLQGKLQELLSWVSGTAESLEGSDYHHETDANSLSRCLQQYKELKEPLAVTKSQLDATAFDIQFLISEHAQDLTPQQSRQLLRLLNELQKAFRDLSEHVTARVEVLQVCLQQVEQTDQVKTLQEQQAAQAQSLAELSRWLSQAEDALVEQQRAASGGDLSALQQRQSHVKELQRNMHTRAASFASILKSTEGFLEENKAKMEPGELAALQEKLQHAKEQYQSLQERTEMAQKELESAVTAAVQQETEKVKAAKELEENSKKIDSLLNWVASLEQKGGLLEYRSHPIEQARGEGAGTGTGDVPDGHTVGADSAAESLDEQYKRLEAQHQELLSQQQDVILATQSAQAFLDKHGHSLAGEEGARLQGRLAELKHQYTASLAQSEARLKHVQVLRDELRKFLRDHGEFEAWLAQAERDLEGMAKGGSDPAALRQLLRRQGSFSEDVISHKGDLRFVTMSGQKVLDAEGDAGSQALMSGSVVRNKLEDATRRYTTLHSKCTKLGSHLSTLLDHYQQFQEVTESLRTWLQESEAAVGKLLSEAVSSDPAVLQKQFASAKQLQGDLAEHQVPVEKLQKAAQSLLEVQGEPAPDHGHIQETTDAIVNRFQGLSQQMAERSDLLQKSIAQSQSVQESLESLLQSVAEIKKSLEREQPAALSSASIQDSLATSAKLKQDIARQKSCLEATREMVTRFMEAADSPTASALQDKLAEATEHFGRLCQQQRDREDALKGLLPKVEQYEQLSEKLQQFTESRARMLASGNQPDRDIARFSQHIQELNSELRQHQEDLAALENLAAELSSCGFAPGASQQQEKLQSLRKDFLQLQKVAEEREKDASSCQEQLDEFRKLVGAMRKWLRESEGKMPPAETSLEQCEGPAEHCLGLLEEWKGKGAQVEEIGHRGTLLENLIVEITAPDTPSKAGSVSSVLTLGCFLATDLTEIQCDVSDVTQQYQGLGAMLQERQQQLSAMLEKMQEVQEEASSMLKWLESKERMLSELDASSSPTKTETMRAQAEHNKAFLAELEQNSGKIQKVKEALSGLLEKYPDSPEAANWKKMQEDLNCRWERASQATAARQQKLEESVNQLASFQAAEAQLRPWLMEKELMMSVLGPLSIDPNMLNAQKQQVQFMLKEFEARRQQHEQLNQAAQSILTGPGDVSPSTNQVREELQGVNQKWSELTERLNSRSSQIDQAIVKSTQYQELLQGLSEKVKAVGQRLSSQSAISTQPDAVKQQLEETSEIRSDLEQLEEEITEAQTLCDDLSVLIGEQYLKDELRKRLETVALPLKGLEDLAADRMNRLQTAFASSQQFQHMFDELRTWLDDKLCQQAQSQPISAKLERLQSQIQEHEEFQKSLNQHSGSYEMIVAEGESLLLSVQPGEEKTTLQNQLVSLKTHWEELSKQAANRHSKLKDCLQKAQKYQRHAEDLLPWVEDCKAKVMELEVTLDPVQLEATLLRSKAMLSDVEKRRSLLEMLNSAADILIDASQTDEDDIRDEKAGINQKMDAITEELQAKTGSIEEMSQRLKEFQESFKNIEKKLEGAKHQLEIYDALGPQACSNKNLEKLRAQQEVLQALEPQVDYLRNLTQGLVEDAPDGSDCSQLLSQAEVAQQDFQAVKQKVNDCCTLMENKLEGIGQFSNRVREMFSQLADLDDELDSMGPIGRDSDSLQSQAEDVRTFLGKLHRLKCDIEASESECKRMLEDEGSPDLLGLKRELETLNKQCSKLTERGKNRQEQVETTLSRVEDFYSRLKELTHMTTAAEDNEALQWVVGTEVETINQQLADFKLFQKEQVDPLQLKLQQVNGVGQGLIRSAGKNCDVQGLEHDMEEINTRWNTLNKKVAQRVAQLQEALLHCGKFQDALEPLLSWLADTEELISNQKPPSAEYKVVKAQIQEQKLLQRLLDDRKATVEMIQAEGGRIAQSAEPADREKIVGQLESLERRWAGLLGSAAGRQKQLEDILVLAKQFHETTEPVSDWLSVTEKKLANSEPIGTQTAKIQQQISRHKALNEEIVNRKKNVDQAIRNGQALLKQTTGEEVLLIQEKLDGIKTRYSDITAASSKALRTLEQARQLATKFQSTHEELTSWMSSVEDELASSGGQSPASEQIPLFQQRQKELKKEVMEHRLVLDTVNEVSRALLELVPWRAREGLDKLVSDTNERYKLVSDTIKQRVEEIDAAIQRSQQYEQAADAELAWVAETKRKLMALGPIRLEQDQTTAQLQVQKAFSIDIIRHKDSMDELFSQRSEIFGTCGEEQRAVLQEKTESLVQQYEAVSQLNSERYTRLERAQVLVNQFWETYEELNPWIEETQALISQLPPPAIDHEQLKQQQEDMRQLRESIAEHKPHIDKLLKIGPQLKDLNPEEGEMVQNKYSTAEAMYARIKEEVCQRALALDEAVSQSTQFHDKIEPMLETLEALSSRLRMPPLIPAEVEKIRECISENKSASVELEKLQPSFEALKRRGEELIGRSQGADKDLAAKVIQDKLDQMVFFWEDIKARAEEREMKFLDVLELAEKFWYDMAALLTTIKDTQDIVHDLESPGIDPSIIKQQVEAAETIKEETDGLHEELEFIRLLGTDLIFACGETEKPEVKKSIDEMNNAWENLNKTWKERLEKLEEAMQSAVQYQDTLQAMFDWLDNAVIKLCNMSPVGTDLNTVKEQMNEMKEFKMEVYQQQIEMEKLNHQGELMLKKATDETDRDIIKEPLTELKHLWENLGEKIAHRQHKLEAALLALGQFQHALAELMAWLTHTEELLDAQKPINGDPKVIEVELAKHHVLKNDVLAHQATVETVNKAGNELLESSAGDDASSLRNRLEKLNSCWESVLQKTEEREQQLQSTLQQAQGFHGEIEDFLLWLTRMESQLSASKPTGGLPETAREQLNAHMELYSQLKAKEDTYSQLLAKGRLMLLNRDDSGSGSKTEQSVALLEQKWCLVSTKMEERKAKLEEALALATDFQNSLQDFINWLTLAEQSLNIAPPASLILSAVLAQIDEHKVFANEVNAHRDQIIELDQTGNQLKFLSQKQDVVLIKNLLVSVQSRWEKVVQRSVERGRALDDARKRAKQFHEAWKKLIDWLEDAENHLDSELEISNDPDKIKLQLSKHKEFQKTLGGKQPVYDTTIRTGRALKEKALLADDTQKLDNLLGEVRDKWDTVCGKSVERQHKLEEALLFSGQFMDALQALVDWLYKVEPQLAEDQPVHGDLDLVMNLMDAHKVFQKELGKRTGTVQVLKRSGRELIDNSRDDTTWVKVQLQELSNRWDTVCKLSVSKQTRLEQALKQAEEFRTAVHMLLEWLSEAEQSLRFRGALPDDAEALQSLIDTHKEFMKKVEEKRVDVNAAVGMGEVILAACHPDCITTIKHWITIIRARFEEVLTWAKQHQQRLESALSELVANAELLEELLAWIQWAETTLIQRDQEPMPQNIDQVKALISEHQSFMEEMTRKQPDVDRVTKTYKRKATEPPHGPFIEKSRSNRKSLSQAAPPSMPIISQSETKNPRINQLSARWQQVWLLALERQRKLNDALDRLEELKEFANFDFDVWRKKYMRWMNHKKSRVMDFFRRIDKDQDGKITRQEFIDGILASKFPTTKLEMTAVADIFDRDGDGYIDYYEFVAALHPNKDAYRPTTDADKIEDEVTRQVAQCKCAKRFQVEQIGENKYRFFLGNQFGDSQQLRLVRILRSTVMVRVGGGWMALDEFLVKNDPCRARGRTNLELREKFILPEGASQGMTPFRSRGRRSKPSSRAASPTRSSSSASQSNHSCASMPSSPATPASGAKVTPSAGSKLKRPTFHSSRTSLAGDTSNSSSPISAGAKTSWADPKRTASRPTSRAGSRTGSRASSRRGSDASDLDVLETQSACSDTSESSAAGGQGGSRRAAAKPSKIPTMSKKATTATPKTPGPKR
uniref:Microtubule actin crosslinking factor 1 n=1 Tax=Amazona collaria TaxID=241587 RepID=A0A8B9GC10_9PSIT